MRTKYLLIGCMLISGCLFAKPSKGKVVKGKAHIRDEKSRVIIDQQSDRAIIHWDEFSLQKEESAHFNQPSSNSAVMNKVTGKNVSEIYGKIQSNGSVYLINKNGILVGPEGQVDVRHFIASSLDIYNAEDFLFSNEMKFQSDSDGKIINHGRINALGGNVILLAKDIENHGEISAQNTQLCARKEALLVEPHNSRVRVIVTDEESEGSITNTGIIKTAVANLDAAGGNMY